MPKTYEIKLNVVGNSRSTDDSLEFIEKYLSDKNATSQDGMQSRKTINVGSDSVLFTSLQTQEVNENCDAVIYVIPINDLISHNDEAFYIQSGTYNKLVADLQSNKKPTILLISEWHYLADDATIKQNPNRRQIVSAIPSVLLAELKSFGVVAVVDIDYRFIQEFTQERMAAVRSALGQLAQAVHLNSSAPVLPMYQHTTNTPSLPSISAKLHIAGECSMAFINQYLCPTSEGEWHKTVKLADKTVNFFCTPLLDENPKNTDAGIIYAVSCHSFSLARLLKPGNKSNWAVVMPTDKNDQQEILQSKRSIEKNYGLKVLCGPEEINQAVLQLAAQCAILEKPVEAANTTTVGESVKRRRTPSL